MIRPLRESDIVSLTEIYNHYVLHSAATFESAPLTVGQMRRRLLEPAATFPCLVVEESGVVGGYAALHSFRPRFDCVAEATMYLAPEFTSRGIGRLMLRRLIEAGRSIEGLNGIIACINAANVPSRQLVESFGFRQVAYYERVGRKFGQWLDDVDYQLLF